MKNVFILFLLLLLSGCAGETVAPARKVSPLVAPVASGMSYDQYRDYADRKAQHDGGDEQWQREEERGNGNIALQKRFMALDRDNNGHLSPNEFNGY